MFNNLSGRLNAVFDKIRARGALSESDVNTAMRDVRIALLEADVALPVVKDFIASVKEKAVGQEVLKSIKPGQMVVKIVHDHLVELLGAENTELEPVTAPPHAILMVGLQGSGKTTTSAKLARLLTTKSRHKVLLASLDIHRPAAQEQLAQLAKQADVTSLPIIADQSAETIAGRAMQMARTEGYDVVILDTAGRLHIDETLMQEAANVRDIAKPKETLLVCDSLTGQDAVNVAREFGEKIGITGVVLTRMDGDARGGAALSMRSVTGKPVKFAGVGEKIDELEPFHADRVAARILDMGDVVSLVERVQETVDQDEAEKLAKKMKKGQFDLDDFATQLKQMQKMGGMGGILSMLPGVGKMKKQIDQAGLDDSMVGRQIAIVSSMTMQERRYTKLLNSSRKKRIARGSGTSVEDVNKLLKQFQQMQKMMKRVKKIGPEKLMAGLPPGMMPPGMGGRM